MDQGRLPINDLTLLLFSGEAHGDETDAGLGNAAQRIFEKLNTHLSRRLGSGGYQALLKRALALAAADFPWLAAVHVTETGDLAGLGTALAGRTALEATQSSRAILASLIGLLETFIGEDLCRGILRAIWPDTMRRDPVQSDPRGTPAAAETERDTHG